MQIPSSCLTRIMSAFKLAEELFGVSAGQPTYTER